MRREMAMGVLAGALMLSLTACGGLSSKVSVVSETVEIGSTFNEKSQFACKDGVTIKLKEGNVVDTSKAGDVSAAFIITSGDKEEEKEYKFKIVDTQPPQIDANNITIYTGMDFDPSAYAKCSDNSGEDIVASVKSNNVDISQQGNYTVVYEAADSAGNTTEQAVDVNVISIETSDDVMDLVDEFLTKNGYSEFTYHKNDLDAVFVDGPALSSYKLDSDRTLDIYPQIYILKDVFKNQFRVNSVIFRMELTDRGELDSRYNLYADKFTVKSLNNTISTENDNISDLGDFEREYYRSKFDYDLSGEELVKLKEMLDSGEVIFDIQPKNAISDYSTFPIISSYEPISITYTLEAADIDKVKQTLEVYDNLLNVLGQYGE